MQFVVHFMCLRSEPMSLFCVTSSCFLFFFSIKRKRAERKATLPVCDDKY